MNEHDLIHYIITNASPLGIAVYALILLRDEGRRNAAALRQLIDEYRASIEALTAAIQNLIKEMNHG